MLRLAAYGDKLQRPEKRSKADAPISWNVPSEPSSCFIGRTAVYRRLASAFIKDTLHAGNSIYVFHGLPGSGKTTLCLRFAWEFRSRYVIPSDGNAKPKQRVLVRTGSMADMGVVLS